MKQKNQEKGLQPHGQMGRAYPVSLRTAALRDYLGGIPRNEVALKYSLPNPSILSHWKRKFTSSKTIKEATKMVKRRNNRLVITDMESLQAQRIAELERTLSSCQQALKQCEEALRESRLRAHISETMIDLAEEKFEIGIRKNFGSK